MPSDLDLHLVVDNYAAHKHPKVRAWLAGRPRFTLHFTPTYASWMNQVERWFALITQRQIRRGSRRFGTSRLQKNLTQNGAVFASLLAIVVAIVVLPAPGAPTTHMTLLKE